jgi:predicted 3-demethylubiquinone-9 3-methyltransferase (glyoxalase superfamily)
MKTRLSLFAAGLAFVFSAQAAMALSRLPTPFLIKGHDAKIMVEVLEASGLQEQSSIETSFFQADEVFCVNASHRKTCQFSVGGGLFVRTASVEDTDAFIKVLRKNGAESYAVNNGRRWDLRNLECSTRFDLTKRQLVSQCTFEQ